MFLFVDKKRSISSPTQPNLSMRMKLHAIEKYPSIRFHFIIFGFRIQKDIFISFVLHHGPCTYEWKQIVAQLVWLHETIVLVCVASISGCHSYFGKAVLMIQSHYDTYNAYGQNRVLAFVGYFIDHFWMIRF